MFLKQALTIGVYDTKLIHQASPYCGDNVFAKGLEANGFQVFRFDYRAAKDSNLELLEFAKTLQDISIVWFGKCEALQPDTIQKLRKLFPTATFCKWAADVRDIPSEHDIRLLDAGIDWFFGTFGGEYLKMHLRKGMTGVASIFTFTDSDYYKPQEVDQQYQSDVLWTGRKGFGDNIMRNQIISELSTLQQYYELHPKVEDHLNIQMFGHDSRKWLGEPEYRYYINGTKIGIGSNSFNRVKYTSDRLGNYLACGTFYLTQYIEGLEELFVRYEDLDWFETTEQMLEKIRFYIDRPQLRYSIAEKGRRKILKYFDHRPLVQNCLEIIKTNKKQHAWEDIFTV